MILPYRAIIRNLVFPKLDALANCLRIVDHVLDKQFVQAASAVAGEVEGDVGETQFV